MGHFVVKKITNVDDLKPDDVIPESDFAQLTPKGNFLQLEYRADDQVKEPYHVKPGIWTIVKTMQGCKLEPTSFVEDKILDSFVATQEITDKIDCFFRNLHVYKEHGISVPKRAALLYGSAGCGKSTAITKVVNKYTSDGKTAVIIWSTDKFEAYQVKDFIKSFDYVDGVNKLILVAEDIGGVEIEQARIKSDSSLLSLLDNKERTFTIPVFILATTNYPENFMGNLTNRPERFDDKIEVGFPKSEARKELLKFFAKTELDGTVLEYMGSEHTKEFSAAHIREVIIRSAIYEKPMLNVMREMVAEIKKYKNAFANKESRMGFMIDDE